MRRGERKGEERKWGKRGEGEGERDKKAKGARDRREKRGMKQKSERPPEGGLNYGISRAFGRICACKELERCS